MSHGAPLDDPAPGAPTGWRSWMAGARPRTLPAAVVPVLVGTACAAGGSGVTAWRAVAVGVVALALQVGTNFANDYSDGVRGTDDPGVRVGPVRLVGWGLQPPKAVKRAALASFGVAGAAGLALAIAVGPQLLLVGAAAMAAGWFYTGGSHPYGYYGLGEVFVFVFFGVVATVGSTYVQTETITALATVASVTVGLLATALLVINNLRDIPGDTLAGKRTLAVRLGDARTRGLYVALLVGAFALVPAVAGGFDRAPAAVALVG
ncbi:MAG: 1,4-dihydroxy-2-naphthoate polyprenyltransferase, partial [Microthrixaceae bacterium]